MKNYIRHYLVFFKGSYSFMKGHNKIWITFNSIIKGFGFAKLMCEWDKASAIQKENWYLSGEGRTIEF